MRVWLAVVVAAAGCGGTAVQPAVPARPPPAPARDLAVAEPAPPVRPTPPKRPTVRVTGPGPIVLRAPLSRDEVIVFDRDYARAEPRAEARSDFWDPCVRDLVAGLPR